MLDSHNTYSRRKAHHTEEEEPLLSDYSDNTSIGSDQSDVEKKMKKDIKVVRFNLLNLF